MVDPINIKYRDSYSVHGGYELEVARGKVDGAMPASSFGELNTGGPVTDHLIWPPVGNPSLNIPPDPGLTMTIVSTSAQDAPAGTGIWSVEVHYLDENLDQQSEIVTLNGLTPVAMAAPFVRFIQCMHMHGYGSGKKAAGNIIANGSDARIYSYIQTGKIRCSSSARRVPRSKKLLMTGIYAGSSSGTADASTQVKLVTTQIDSNEFVEQEILFPQAGISVQDSSVAMPLSLPFPIFAGGVVGLTVTTDKASVVNAGWFGWFENSI